MACTNTQMRDTLLEMQEDGMRFDKDNERTIWHALFLRGIFQMAIPEQYWVSDALDECTNYVSFFDSMLAKLDQSTPLRVLITSRETPKSANHFSSLGTHRFQHGKISTADTLPDIKLLVEAKAKSI